MEVYVIAPIHNLELMNLGDRIFVLSHLYIKYEFYRDFVQDQKKKGKYITLDNSAAERSLVTEDTLIEICHELVPDEVIAPDVLFDKNKTISNYKTFRDRMKTEGLLDKIKIFFCPQGNTMTEWMSCFEFAVLDPDIEVIGFSKIAIPKCFLGENQDDQGIKEARHLAYDYVKSIGLLIKPIHCLGQGDPSEFKYYDHPMMRSTDSVYPVLAAKYPSTNYTDSESFQRVPTKHDFLEVGILTPFECEKAEKNVKYLLSCCSK